MAAFDNLRDTFRKHSGKILSGIGAALVTPLVARIAARWTGRAVDKVWGDDSETSASDPTESFEAETTSDAAGEVSDDSSTSGDEEYSEWTKKELYSLAQDLDIHGRSQMNKAELIEAIRAHEAE